MKRPRQTIRRYAMPLALACLLLTLFAAPLFISSRHQNLTLQSAAVYAASSDSYSLSAPVRLMSGPTIQLESGTLSMPPSRTGLARSGQMIAMLITGSGPQMSLENATFTADFSTREPTFSQEPPGEEVAPLVKALQSMQFAGLTVRSSTMRIRMADGALAELQDINATISGKPNGAISASGSFQFRGETIEFDTALGASLDAQGMSRPISASFTGKPLTASIEGSLMLGESPQLLAPHADLTTADLRATARWLGVNWPSGDGFGPFHAKGQLEWVGRTMAFQNTTLELDENDATGTLSINFSGPRPAVEGTLGLKTLDLTQYLKPRTAATAQSNESLLTSIRGSSGLEFPLIDAVDADFRISSDRVTLPATSIGRSAATVSLRDGKMLADIAELEFDDGTRGGGQIRIDQSGPDPSFGMQVKFESPDVGRAVQAVFGHPTVQGRGAVTIDLTARGDDGEELLRSLDGKLCATLLEGGRIGIDVNMLTAPETGTLSASAWQQVSTSAISVDKLDARFIVTKGILRAQTAEAISGQRALKADGTISLIEGQLDMMLAVGDATKSAPDADGRAPAKVIMSPREIVNMRGPWSAPAVRNAPAGDAGPTVAAPAPG